MCFPRLHSYLFDRPFILHYAELASSLDVEIFSVSCELTEVSKQTAQWKDLVPKIRQAFPNGLLTSSANWAPPGGAGEVVDKDWWDLMDFIGVDEYYHGLSNISYPTLDQMIESWAPIVDQLANLR